MEDTADKGKAAVLRVAEMLDLHNGENTIVLDLTGQCVWADYMIISTVTSQSHLRGLARRLKDLLSELSVSPLNRRWKLGDEGWFLLDCGDFVINLMNKDMREFYNLERLWFSSKVLYQSSKSS